MENNSEEYRLKIRQLDLQQMTLKNDMFLQILKTSTTGVVVTLIPAIINYQIQHQEIEIK